MISPRWSNFQCAQTGLSAPPSVFYCFGWWGWFQIQTSLSDDRDKRSSVQAATFNCEPLYISADISCCMGFGASCSVYLMVHALNFPMCLQGKNNGWPWLVSLHCVIILAHWIMENICNQATSFLPIRTFSLKYSVSKSYLVVHFIKSLSCGL